MFFTMTMTKKSPIPIIPIMSLGTTNKQKQWKENKPNIQFGMISRIQEKTFCFSCGK